MTTLTPYVRNKAKRNKDIDNFNRKILILAKKLKAIQEMGGCCEKCGEDKLWNLCFHHKNPLEKEFDINFLRSSKVRFSDLMKEIKKCQLLCQNCHRETHFELIESNHRQRLNKKILLNYKKTNKCFNCNYDKCDGSLEFHHKNPSEKETKLSTFIYNHSWKSVDDLSSEVKQELDKCVVVCRNCHQSIHTDKDFIIENWELICEKSKTLVEKNSIDYDQVIQLNKQGFDRFEISKKLKCSPIRIYEILKSNDLLPPKHKIDKKLIIDLFRNGVRIADIVRKTKFSKSSVLKTIKEYKNEDNSRTD